MKSVFYPSIIIALALSQPAAHGQGLQPDPTFGTNGQVLTGTSSAPAPADRPVDMEVLPNNQLVVLAQSTSGLVKLRYNADGSLDATYGTAGRLAVAALPAGFTASGRKNYADLLANGRVVVEGTASGNYALTQYNADGSLDTGFGTAGIVSIPNLTASRFMVQPDSKVVVTGATPLQTSVGTFVGGQMRVTRLLPTGTTEFSVLFTHLLTAPATTVNHQAIVDSPEAVVQADGKILVVGTGTDRFSAPVFLAQARLLPDGTPDANFGTNGAQLLYVNSNVPYSANGSSEKALLALPDGKFLLNFKSSTANAAQATIARFQENGQLDLTYGKKGLVPISYDDCPNAGAIWCLQPDGKLLLGGATTRQNVMRLTAQGSVDQSLVPPMAPSSFNYYYLTNSFPPAGAFGDGDFLTHIIVTPANQVLLGGGSSRQTATATRPAGTLVALARYTGSGIATSTARNTLGVAVQVYPNPLSAAKNQLQVAGLPGNKAFAATLYNAMGQVMQRSTLLPAAAGSSATLAIAPMPVGIYRLQLANDYGSQSFSLAIE
jgi:uncharacterized delta-60 repeat protein